MNWTIPEKLRYIHLIGCAGAGTLPLARIFLELGFHCSGSDLLSTSGTDQLIRDGLDFHCGHCASNLLPGLAAENALVVYTSAAAEENSELVEARRRGICCVRRGEALAWLGTRFPHTLAVCGSHGKTSVTSLCAFALQELGYAPGYLIGGSVSTWSVSGTAGGRKYFVTEVDESDSTNALFHAETAVVTNIEDDHAWSVGGVDALYASFSRFAGNARKLVYVRGPVPDQIFSNQKNAKVLEPGLFPDWPFPAQWGGFQKRNAVTAYYALKTWLPELKDSELIPALMRFPGVERRMSLRFDNRDFRIIEDYAHHPTELKASLSALRETNPGRRLVVIFQPHRYARLKRYLAEFTAVLKTADRVLVTPVFAAWTASSDVNSETLVSQLGSHASTVSGDWKAAAEAIRPELKTGDLIAVIGAGDIRNIIPELIKQISG